MARGAPRGVHREELHNVCTNTAVEPVANGNCREKKMRFSRERATQTLHRSRQ